jgi:hypothetical protein
MEMVGMTEAQQVEARQFRLSEVMSKDQFPAWVPFICRLMGHKWEDDPQSQRTVCVRCGFEK